MSGPRVFILAGGLGTRLRPVIGDSVPKPMADVNGRPFLEWLLILLRGHGLRDFVISTGYKGEVIERYFGDGSRLGVSIEYSREESPLGTGGALRRAEPLLSGGDFLVVNGDTYLEADPRPLLEARASSGSIGVLGLVEARGPRKGGFVELEGDRVVAFREGVGTGRMYAGVAAFSPEVFRAMPGSERFSLEEDLLPSLASSGSLRGLPMEGTFIDIGTPEGYAAARATIGRGSRWAR